MISYDLFKMSRILEDNDILYALQSYPIYNGKVYVVSFINSRDYNGVKYYITNDPLDLMSVLIKDEDNENAVEDWMDMFELVHKEDNGLDFNDYFYLRFANKEYRDLFYNVLDEHIKSNKNNEEK